VEDEIGQLTTVAKMLRTAGFDVVAASDGASAIGTTRKDQPGLILLDLGLPAGDGLVVLKRLPNLIPTATIPVIMHTARHPAQNRDAALAAGAVAYLEKPADKDKVLQAIKEVLGDS
jgi:two-component system, OmpR family, response regulator